MIRRPNILAAVAAALCLPLALGGCISLFPKAKPVQLYRFGADLPPAAASASIASPVIVQRGEIAFPPAAAADQILTVTGQETAYVAAARWVSPAALMFEAAVSHAFDAPGAPRLVERGEPLKAATNLRLDVRAFEVRYDAGPSSSPTVVVQVRATLIRNADRTLVAEKMFDVRQPASDNRVGAIVQAFNAAVGQTVGGIRDWTAATAGGVR